MKHLSWILATTLGAFIGCYLAVPLGVAEMPNYGIALGAAIGSGLAFWGMPMREGEGS